MVTFIDGESDRRWYRHFKIKTVIGPDDFLSMKEVLSRRATHFDDWGKPNLIIVDGGKGQVSSVSDIIPSDISYVGLAKRLETLVVPYNGEFIELVVPPGPALTLVQRIRDEAHRFARRYHHKLVAKAIRSGNT
jgi:excinuclease ABC subunit C